MIGTRKAFSVGRGHDLEGERELALRLRGFIFRWKGKTLQGSLICQRLSINHRLEKGIDRLTREGISKRVVLQSFDSRLMSTSIDYYQITGRSGSHLKS